jgi:hypothetical protein
MDEGPGPDMRCIRSSLIRVDFLYVFKPSTPIFLRRKSLAIVPSFPFWREEARAGRLFGSDHLGVPRHGHQAQLWRVR